MARLGLELLAVALFPLWVGGSRAGATVAATLVAVGVLFIVGVALRAVPKGKVSGLMIEKWGTYLLYGLIAAVVLRDPAGLANVVEAFGKSTSSVFGVLVGRS